MGADITVTAPFTVTAINTSNGQNCHGVSLSNGVLTISDGSAVVTMSGTSTSTAGNASGIELTGISGTVCSTPPCNWILNGDSTVAASGNYGIVSSGNNNFRDTAMVWTGNSAGFHGIGIFFNTIVSSGIGNFELIGSTSGAGRSGVYFGVDGTAIATDGTNVIMTGTAPFAFDEISYQRAYNPPSQTFGSVVYNSPVRFSGGVTFTGYHNVEILGGCLCTSGLFQLSNQGETTLAGPLSIVSIGNPSVGPGVLVKWATSELQISSVLSILSPTTLIGNVEVNTVSPSASLALMATLDGAFDLVGSGSGTIEVFASVGAVTRLASITMASTLAVFRVQSTVGGVETAAGQVYGCPVESLSPGISFASFDTSGELTFAGINGSPVALKGNTIVVSGAVTSELAVTNTGIAGTRLVSLSGTYAAGVTVFSDMQLSTDADFQQELHMRAQSVLNASNSGGVLGCASVAGLFMEDTSTLAIDMGSTDVPCTGFDSFSVSSSVVISPTALVTFAGGPPPRGATFFFVRGQDSATGAFSNLAEGATVTVGGVVLTATYLLDETFIPGVDFALVSNSLPVAVDDAYTISALVHIEPSPGLLGNDMDPDGCCVTAAFVASNPPMGEGTVVLVSDGSFTYTSGGFIGPTSFTYVITDSLETSAPATVLLTVVDGSPTPTTTATFTVTDTSTATATPTATPPPSATPSMTRTASTSRSTTISKTASSSFTNSPTPTSTVTPTISLTRTGTGTASTSKSPTATITPTGTPTVTTTASPSETPSGTHSPSSTRSIVVGDNGLEAPLPDPSALPSPSISPSMSPIIDASPSRTSTLSPSTNRPVIEVVVVGGEQSTEPVPVMNPSGQEVATVAVPDSVDGVLVITTNEDLPVTQEVSSIVLDVTILSDSGEEVTKFEEPIELCFASSHAADDVCLGFYNAKGEWECEDYCLTSQGSGVCGKTDHLTNFALLLDSSAGSDEKCGSQSSDFLIIYLSIAFVGLAACIVVAAIVAYEIKHRLAMAEREASFRSIGRGIASASQS